MPLAGLADIGLDIVTIDTLLGAEETSERVLVAAKAALELAGLTGRCPRYLAAFETALRASPPYGTKAYADAYREASADRRWMAASLITNAHGEGEGATRLWSLAACSGDEDIRELLKRHAVDESTHARYYLSFLDLALPDAVDETFRTELRQLSPGYTMSQPLFVAEDTYGRAPTIDDFIQVNIAEIRTTIHHLLQREALKSYCDAEALPRLMKLLDRLLNDELRHVGYTAALIEKLSAGVDLDRLIGLFCSRFGEFNAITTQQMDRGQFD